MRGIEFDMLSKKLRGRYSESTLALVVVRVSCVVLGVVLTSKTRGTCRILPSCSSLWQGHNKRMVGDSTNSLVDSSNKLTRTLMAYLPGLYRMVWNHKQPVELEIHHAQPSLHNRTVIPMYSV